jgi:hypothetical protein
MVFKLTNPSRTEIKDLKKYAESISAFMENTRSLFKHNWRISGKYSNVHGEYGKFRVISSLKKPNLNVLGEYAKSI